MLAYTIEQQGKSVLLKCSNNESLTTDDWDLATAFLLQPCGDSFAIVYNLDKFVDILTDLLDKKLKNKVLECGRTLIDNRLIYYQTSRIFGVNHINIYPTKLYANTEPSDVHKLLELANNVVNAYKKLGIIPTKLSSPVAVFSEKLKELPFPRASDLSSNALPLIDSTAKTMSNEWRDTFKLGHWNANEVTDLDLTNAYGSLIANLPDISEATFFESDKIPDKYSWGEMQGIITVVNPISPFYYEKVNGFPIGSFPASITSEQLWLLNKYVGSFEMKSGQFLTLPNKYGYPFKDTMDKLYNARGIDSLVATIAKGISVGIGGQFQQRFDDGKLGGNFNSIYARMITSRCLIRTASFTYHNKISPISVTVDGILAEGQINIPEIKKNGEWRKEPTSPALVLSQLYQWINDKHPNSQFYPEIMAEINNNPSNSVYGELDFHLLEYSRHFSKLPQNGKDLISNKFTSEPIKV